MIADPEPAPAQALVLAPHALAPVDSNLAPSAATAPTCGFALQEVAIDPPLPIALAVSANSCHAAADAASLRPAAQSVVADFPGKVVARPGPAAQSAVAHLPGEAVLRPGPAVQSVVADFPGEAVLRPGPAEQAVVADLPEHDCLASDI